MKRTLILVALMLLLVAIAAVPAFAMLAPNGGPHDIGGGFCSPWDWAWFKAGNWWYFQWFQWCWDPQGGWSQMWGSWGWE